MSQPAYSAAVIPPRPNRPRESRSPAGVIIRGSVYDGSGYADETRGIVFGLHRAGFPVQVEPMGLQHDLQNILTVEERDTLEVLKHRKLELARGVHFQHYPANDFNLAMYGRYRVGRTMYETDSI